MRLSAEDQTAVLIRARALLAQRDGWRNEGRAESTTPRGRSGANDRLTLGQACQQAAFELGLVSMRKSNTYTVALAVGLLKVVEHWGHRSLAGFNNDPETMKKDMMGLIDRRLVELL